MFQWVVFDINCRCCHCCFTAGAWSEFMAAAAAAPDLDCLIAAHDKFLCGVLDRALLGGGQKSQQQQDTLKELLKNCTGLGPVVENFRKAVSAYSRWCNFVAPVSCYLHLESPLWCVYCQ